ncbi:MAG: MBL fold metallo-hydrolase [Okeania sp. SIO2C2]|uniref:MBL fold metallo-hydrolase n=1 Tax=Okeania sp. SIO2C2 TaxID=2607787 RepID=UPI0013B93057|nr:MBL fold metallo-hydrolase [Okeania sp. SIO2C2]NEP89657.1 MBL fold metallo-hydrolase [Okeania sp. SIO2C2]
MHLTWLDSNSWLIEIGGKQLLLDPWLVGPLVFGNLPWLFKGERRTPRAIPEKIDLIVLSQGLEDHAHPQTLKQLDKNIPVVASPTAAKVVQELGYSQIVTLAHGETYSFDNSIEIRAVPGSLVGPTLVENGYIFKDLSTDNTIYYEPHGSHSEKIKEFAPINVVITPIINLNLPLVGPIIKGNESALQVAQWLKPQVMLPTAAGGDIDFQGLLISLLKADGSVEETQLQLTKNNLETKVIEAQPGERFELQLEQRVLAN